MGVEREYNGPTIFVEHNDETKHTGEVNLLQIELALRKYSLDSETNDEKVVKWTTNEGRRYSKEFRILLDEELDKNKTFWTDIKNKEYHDDFLKRIEEELYKDDSPQDAKKLAA